MPRHARSHERMLFLAFASTVLAFVASSAYRELRLAEISHLRWACCASSLPALS